MPFARRQRFAPIQKDKHEVTWVNLAQNASTQQNVLLAQPVQPSAVSSSTETSIGSHVKAVYLEFHFSAENIASPKIITWTVQVVPSGLSAIGTAVYYQTRRAYVIKRGMEMLPKDVSTVTKRVMLVLIPKPYQRQKTDQELIFSYTCSSTETINACGFAIYKVIT